MPKKYDFAGQMDEGHESSEAMPSFEDVYGVDLPKSAALAAVFQQKGAVIEIGNFSLSATGLEIVADIDEAQWLAFFEALRSIRRALQWIIGDWLNYGIERKWGQTYEEFAQLTGLKVKTLQEYAYVSHHIDSSIRMEELPFGHHQLVAGMGPKDQRYWLNVALENNLSRAKLREAISGEVEERDDIGLSIQRRRMTKITRFLSKAHAGELSRREQEKALGEIAAARRWLDAAEVSLAQDE